MFRDALQMSRRNGDRFGLAHSTLGLACLATDAADWRRAAELHGVVDTFLAEMGQPWLFYWKPLRQDSIDTVSTCLGTEEFQRFRLKGHELKVDDAVELAFGRGIPADLSQARATK